MEQKNKTPQKSPMLLDIIDRRLTRPNVKELIEKVDPSTPVKTGAWLMADESGKIIGLDPFGRPPTSNRNIMMRHYMEQTPALRAMTDDYKAGREISYSMIDTEAEIDPELWAKQVKELVDSGAQTIEIDSYSQLKEE